MTDKIVQLVDNENNNIYPVAGSLAQGSVTTSTINDGAVTGAKIDWGDISLGEVVDLSLASGVTLPNTAYNGTNSVLSTSNTAFSGGTYLLSMCSVPVLLSNKDYQANVGYRIDGGDWISVLDWAHFGTESGLNGSVNFSVPVVISAGNHTVEIGFGTNNAGKTITVDGAQAIKATLTKVGY